MSERANILRCLDAAEFALYETRLFLDTHPCDGEAQAAAEEYARRTRLLRARYEEQFGPLTAKAAAEQAGSPAEDATENAGKSAARCEMSCHGTNAAKTVPEGTCCAWLRGPWPWEYDGEGRR